LIAVGVDVLEPCAEFEPVDLNAGMFTAIIHEIDVPILRTANLAERLLEYVFYPVEDDCELIDLNVVVPFFQKSTYTVWTPQVLLRWIVNLDYDQR